MFAACGDICNAPQRAMVPAADTTFPPSEVAPESVTAVGPAGSDQAANASPPPRILSEIEQLKEAPKDYNAIPSDCWGAGIYSLLKDLPDIMHGEATPDSKFRFFFTMFVLLLNLILQGMLLLWIKIYVMDPSMRTAQDNYQAFHRDIFDENGHLDPAAFDDFEGKGELCQSALSNTGFIAAILFMWTVTCFTELRNTQRLIAQFSALPALPEGCNTVDMVHETGDTEELICLSGSARASLWIIIFVPKLFIVLFLTFTGGVWLTATESFADLILNALALEFVVGIDEVLFGSFLPSSAVKALESMQIATALIPEEEKESPLRGYGRSLVYLAVQLVLVYSYLNYLQPVLPGFRHDVSDACHNYLVTELTPSCTLFFGSECFPFGQAAGAGEEPKLEHKSAQTHTDDAPPAESKPAHKSTKGDSAGESDTAGQEKPAAGSDTKQSDAKEGDQEKTHRV
mmetsp:Transcript_18339/g.44165  ORF Transcript_18339/g.44165 Transcript_18339/m.44165 type:complete len:458 (+) Transcript_18339:3-1376(+)